MIARTLIMHIAERLLNRVSPQAVLGKNITSKRG